MHWTELVCCNVLPQRNKFFSAIFLGWERTSGMCQSQWHLSQVWRSELLSMPETKHPVNPSLRNAEVWRAIKRNWSLPAFTTWQTSSLNSCCLPVQKNVWRKVPLCIFWSLTLRSIYLGGVGPCLDLEQRHWGYTGIFQHGLIICLEGATAGQGAMCKSEQDTVLWVPCVSLANQNCLIFQTLSFLYINMYFFLSLSVQTHTSGEFLNLLFKLL